MKTKLSFLVFALCLLGSTQVSAQLSAGAGLAFGSETEDLGIRATALYQFNENWRAATDFIWYLDGEEDVSVWELNLNAHYIFFEDGKFLAYGLAGLNLVGVSVDLGPLGDESDTEGGINLGVGGQYKINETISIQSELKYSLSDFDQIVFGIGALIAIDTGK
jgi:opacity protein-like surface antigen